MSRVETCGKDNVEILLIGNKNDLAKKVTTERAEEYAKSKNIEFLEVSAKNSDSAQQAFLILTRKLIDKREATKEQNLESAQDEGNTQMLLSDNKSKKKNYKCCCCSY